MDNKFDHRVASVVIGVVVVVGLALVVATKVQWQCFSYGGATRCGLALKTTAPPLFGEPAKPLALVPAPALPAPVAGQLVTGTVIPKYDDN